MVPIQHDAPVIVAALRAERAELQARVEDLAASIASMIASADGANNDDEHDPEGATIAFERSQAQALAQVSVTHLAEIDAALARLDAGTYGLCVRCGQPIAPARLEARPAAATCVTC